MSLLEQLDILYNDALVLHNTIYPDGNLRTEELAEYYNNLRAFIIERDENESGYNQSAK
jgi:hypothetical protein